MKISSRSLIAAGSSTLIVIAVTTNLFFPLTRVIAQFSATPGLAASSPRLGAYKIDIQQTSVSGVSSGAAMAVQIHVAHSSIMRGVGVVAGVAYDCADSSLPTLELRAVRGLTCMEGDLLFGSAGADFSVARTTAAAAVPGAIDPTAHLLGQKVWLFSGYNDGAVRRGAMDAVALYYGHYVEPGNVNSGHIFYQTDNHAPHALVTNGYGGVCLGINDEWINDCKYDAAGHLLEHIYGSLNAPGGTSAGSILEFDQREFAPKNDANSIGLADKGFVYVPMDCLSQTCRVHVVFHGCLQYAGNPKVGRAVVERGGYNRWAETNRFIVLYPQTNDDQRGCWDWLGFKNTNDFARKAGGQISAIRAMLDRLAENFVPGAGSSDTFGTPQHFRVADKTSTSVALTWQPNSAATGFNIYRSGSSGGPYTIINAVPITGAAFADRGLTASTTYHYEIRAIDGAGQESAPTNPAVVGVTGMAPSPCEPYFSNNSMHAARVRALPLPDIFGNARAVGSLDNMGPLTDHDFSQLIKEDRPFPFYHVRYCP